MSGVDAQRGFIFQTIIAMIECLQRDDWNTVKLEPQTNDDKIDIQLYRNGEIISAIQVKSSRKAFSRPCVEKWLNDVKADAVGANEVWLYLVGDNFTSGCKEFIASRPEIRTFSFGNLEENCRRNLESYIYGHEPGRQVGNEDLQLIYNNVFAEFHNNSIRKEPVEKDVFQKSFKRLLSVPRCLTPIPTVNYKVGLVGRDSIIKMIQQQLEKDRFAVLVSGLGGIGKSAVMRWVCENIRVDGDNTHHIAWISCGESLKTDLLMLSDAFGIPVNEDTETAYIKIVNRLKTFDGVLYLFMDNMARIPDDAELSLLNSFTNVRLLISSRHDIGDIVPIELGALEKDDAVDMFYRYYTRDSVRFFRETVTRIIEAVNRHTLLIELLAKAAKMAGGSLNMFNEKLEKKGFFDVFKLKITSKHDENLTIEESIMKLYEISELSDEQKHIMRFFSVFSPEKEIYYEVSDWAGLDGNELEKLIQLGWLIRGESEGGYIIHQIIKDSLERQMIRDGYGVDYLHCSDFINKVINIQEYIPQELAYTRAQERLVMAEDIANYISMQIILSEKAHDRGQLLILCIVGRSIFNAIAGVCYERGDYEKALDYFTRVLAIDKNLFGTKTLEIGKTYNNIGGVYNKTGNLDEAEIYYLKSLTIREKILGKDHPDLAQLYNNLAALCIEKGDYNKAETYFEKALTVNLGEENEETAAVIMSNMATLFRQTGNLEKAFYLNNKYLRKFEEQLGTEHPLTATLYNNLGMVCYDLGEYQKAVSYFKQALIIREHILATDHPDVAMTYINLADTFSKIGNFEKALEYNQKALEIRQKVLGEENNNTAVSYGHLAEAYKQLGNNDLAVKYYEKAIEIIEKLDGLDSVDVLVMYGIIAELTNQSGDLDKALLYYEKILNYCERVLGKDDPTIAAMYAKVIKVSFDQGDYQNALPYFYQYLLIYEKTIRTKPSEVARMNSEILEILDRVNYADDEAYYHTTRLIESVLGGDHPILAFNYRNRASMLQYKGEYNNALKADNMALIIYEEMPEKPYTELVGLFNEIGVTYRKQNRYDKALEFYNKALDIYENVLGTDHSDIGTTYSNMAVVYTNQGDYDKAIEYNIKALNIREKTLGVNHPDTATTYNNLGYTYYETGDNEKARLFFNKALTIREKVLGQNHPMTASTYNNIASLYMSENDHKSALNYYLKAISSNEKSKKADTYDLAVLYNNVGNLYIKERDYAKAMEYCNKALIIGEGSLGLDNLATANTYYNIGKIYNEQKDFANALFYYEKAYDILRKVLGTNHPHSKITQECIEEIIKLK